MAPTTCVVCSGAKVDRVVSAVGERAYCGECFHGWRTDHRAYAYSQVAMCSLGTSQERLRAQIQFFAPFSADQAAILEIGCATGELAEATRRALDPARYDAIELSPAGEQAARHLDRLYTRPLRDLLAAGEIEGRYDLVLMSHVLEHIDDPAAEILAIRHVLAPGGSVFLEVPNGSGNRRLAIDDNRSHLHFFSATSLTRLLANQGLQTLASATDVRLDARYADSLQVVARKFAVPTWSSSLLSDHPMLAQHSEIVVWGAGDVADEVLANFFDPGKIDFFIDRDVRKQQSLCLGRPVRSPESLGTAPRTILINSIDFAPAIEADIDRLYPDHAHRTVRIGDLLGG